MGNGAKSDRSQVDADRSGFSRSIQYNLYNTTRELVSDTSCDCQYVQDKNILHVDITLHAQNSYIALKIFRTDKFLKYNYGL